MQLIIKNGKVIATHQDHQVIADKYPDTECILWDKDLERLIDENGMPVEPLDPRTNEEKDLAYLDQRRIAYPKIEDQLDMIYWDKVNGTDTWKTEIARIKNLFKVTI